MGFDGRVVSGIGVVAAVIDAGNFVGAGRALGLTQSGVSRARARGSNSASACACSSAMRAQ